MRLFQVLLFSLILLFQVLHSSLILHCIKQFYLFEMTDCEQYGPTPLVLETCYYEVLYDRKSWL